MRPAAIGLQAKATQYNALYSAESTAGTKGPDAEQDYDWRKSTISIERAPGISIHQSTADPANAAPAIGPRRPEDHASCISPGLNIHRQINACTAQGEGLYEVWAIYYWIIRIKSNRSPQPRKYISLLNCCSYSTFIVLAEAGQDVAVDTRATGAPPNVYRTSTFPTAFCAGWSELWRLWFIYTGSW